MSEEQTKINIKKQNNEEKLSQSHKLGIVLYFVVVCSYLYFI